MEKVSVTVRIPALNGTYEFIVPSNMSIQNVQMLMIRILNSEYGVQENFSDAMLFDEEDLNALNVDCSFEQLNILDGAKLLLV